MSHLDRGRSLLAGSSTCELSYFKNMKSMLSDLGGRRAGAKKHVSVLVHAELQPQGCQDVVLHSSQSITE